MDPVEFPEANVSLRKPEGMTNEECVSLPVHRTADGQCISCWRPTAEERESIAAGGDVWLSVLSGQTQPPVLVTARSPFMSSKVGDVDATEGRGRG